MRKLYEINAEVERLLDEESTLRLDNGQAVDVETGEIFSLEKRLEDLKLEKEEKIESVALYAGDMIERKSSLDARIKSLQEISKSLQKQIDGLTNYILFATENSGLETANVLVKVKKNAPKTIIENETELPKCFIRRVTKVETSPDKTAIKKAIQAGEIVPGAHLENSYSVTII